MIQSGNWRVARDTVWKLEGCTLHVSDPARELKGASDAGK